MKKKFNISRTSSLYLTKEDVKLLKFSKNELLKAGADASASLIFRSALRVADFDSLLTTVKALGAEERRSKLSRLKKLNDRHKLSQLDLPVATTPQDFSNLAS